MRLWMAQRPWLFLAQRNGLGLSRRRPDPGSVSTAADGGRRTAGGGRRAAGGGPLGARGQAAGGRFGYKPSSPAKSASSRRSFMVTRKRAASAPSTMRWS